METLKGWLDGFEGGREEGVFSGNTYGSSDMKPWVTDGNKLFEHSWMDVSMSFGARDDKHKEVML